MGIVAEACWRLTLSLGWSGRAESGLFARGIGDRGSCAVVAPIQQWSAGVVCHEYRQSKRRCATVREMKVGLLAKNFAHEPPSTSRCRQSWD
jgi:hypothetical protein